MTPKDKRTIDVDLELLFSPKAFLKINSIDDLKTIRLVNLSIHIDDGRFHPLSVAGVAALKRLTSTIQAMPELKGCSRNEIEQGVHGSYKSWIKQHMQPDAEEFLVECRDKLLSTVREHSHLIKFTGLKLENIDHIELGPMTICAPDMHRLKHVQFRGLISSEMIETQFKDDLWLIGKSHGSAEVALSRFKHQTILTVGILAVCGSILFKGAIWKTHLCTGLSPLDKRDFFYTLRWTDEGKNPHVTQSWANAKKLPLNAEQIEYLRRECFLKEMSNLMELGVRSEVQEAIQRALYWYADAHGDQHDTMRFVKLWSCAECFFAISKDEVTEANARGIATILTCAGFDISKIKDYVHLKRRLKKLYDLRSRAIHRAEFDGVKMQDLQDLSRWVAWLIVSMTAIADRGYDTLASVREQAMKLDSHIQQKKKTDLA